LKLKDSDSILKLASSMNNDFNIASIAIYPLANQYFNKPSNIKKIAALTF